MDHYFDGASELEPLRLILGLAFNTFYRQTD
jgi:hypothetical protein